MGHLAVWAGLYAAAAVVCFAQIAGIDSRIPSPRRLLAVAFAFCAAVAVYLLDRVKLRDALLDPADAAAHPERFNFLSRRAPRVRRLIAALVLLAAVGGLALSPWLATLPVLGCAGVLVYAGRPRRERARPKDVLLIKNGYVAAGITGFGVLVALGAARIGDLPAYLSAQAVPLAFSAGHLFLRVFADAALCDLDDLQSDRAHGTGTLPTHLGRARAWNVSMGIRLLLGAALLLVPIGPVHARVAWAVVTIASSLALRLFAPPRVRDWVDARFALEAMVATAAVGLWR